MNEEYIETLVHYLKKIGEGLSIQDSAEPEFFEYQLTFLDEVKEIITLEAKVPLIREWIVLIADSLCAADCSPFALLPGFREEKEEEINKLIVFIYGYPVLREADVKRSAIAKEFVVFYIELLYAYYVFKLEALKKGEDPDSSTTSLEA